MITIKMVEVYDEYKGQYDGYIIRRRLPGLKAKITDQQWYMIESFVQDIYLFYQKTVSEDFTRNLEDSLLENCDSIETINKLKSIAVPIVELKTAFITKDKFK